MSDSIECAPLLSGNGDVYDRFSSSKKRVIVAVVSWTGLLPRSFIPSIPQIAKDFHSSGPVVNLAVSLSILFASLSSLLWATYSRFYGRRPVYLASLPLLCVGSLGVGSARNIPMLMAFRILQAAGSAAGMSVGSGAIGDIYRLEERGTAMGIFFAACLLGPAIAPLAGGIATYYFTWRHMQYALFFAGLLAFSLILFFLPETSHPGTRGIDKERTAGKYRRWVWLNPLSGLALLRSPNLMAVTLAGTVVLLTDYVLLIPLAYTIGRSYGITNEAIIGAFFLPAGLGNLLGAPIAGRLSDKSVIYWRKRRNGEWVPEDRLRVTTIGTVFLVPSSVLCSGICTRYVPGTLGIILNLLCLFANGLGVDFVLSPMAAYNVDIMHSRSAEIMAASGGFRGILLAIVATIILPSINTIGALPTNVISALLAWVGALLMWMTIKYGDQMRAYVDVGFSTISTT